MNDMFIWISGRGTILREELMVQQFGDTSERIALTDKQAKILAEQALSLTADPLIREALDEVPGDTIYSVLNAVLSVPGHPLRETLIELAAQKGINPWHEYTPQDLRAIANAKRMRMRYHLDSSVLS